MHRGKPRFPPPTNPVDLLNAPEREEWILLKEDRYAWGPTGSCKHDPLNDPDSRSCTLENLYDGTTYRVRVQKICRQPYLRSQVLGRRFNYDPLMGYADGKVFYRISSSEFTTLRNDPPRLL
jgi:hypothetical protein